MPKKSLGLRIVLLLLLAVSLCAASAETLNAASVHFSEVMTSNASYPPYSDCEACDWIELQNDTDEDISLDGCSVMLSEKQEITVLHSVTVPAHGNAVLIADGEETASTESCPHLSFKLPSGGCTLILMDRQGNSIDTLTVPSLQKDTSYQLGGDGIWTADQIPTPGERISTAAAEGEEATETAEVRFTEAMASNNSYPVTDAGICTDYIELYNAGETDVDLTGWALRGEEDADRNWLFPDGTILAPGAYLVIGCGGKDLADRDAMIADFRLPKDGISIALYSPNSRQAVDSLKIPALESDQAYSLLDEEWYTNILPTPGYANDTDGTDLEYALLNAGNTTGIVLSEISPDGDWIEVLNSGSQTVNLSGWGLSDSTDAPRKWRFPEGTVIDPGAYLLIECVGDEQTDSEQSDTEQSGDGLTADFKLSRANGETIVLSLSDGTIIDRAAFSVIPYGYTLGRVPGSNIWRMYRGGTPGAENSGDYAEGKAETPVYSVSGGLYTGELTVELTSPTAGSTVYYTLDGSVPDTSSIAYTGPIDVKITTVIRCRAFKDGLMESDVGSETYFINVDRGDSGKVYVVSLVADPKDITDPDTGIIYNYNPKTLLDGGTGDASEEKEAHIEIYDPSGDRILAEGCGVQLHGQGSRNLPQQGFRIIADQQYGCSEFQAALFTNRPYTTYKSFLLRASGQDYKHSHMRDSVLQKLAVGTGLIYQESETCLLYINGNYWGLYYLRERLNPTTICREEGWEGQEDNLDVVKAECITSRGSNQSFEDLLAWMAEHDPTEDGFYEHVAEEVDLENYIKFMSIEIFVGNGDAWNSKRYRNASEDGKWRWVLFDLDWGFQTDTDSINRWLDPAGMGSRQVNNTLFITMLKNPRFREEFLTYFGTQLTTVFTSEHMTELFTAQYEILEPLIDAELERWDISRTKFDNQVKDIMAYCQERPAKIIGYFKNCERLGLTDEEYHRYFDAALAYIDAQ